MRYYFGAQDVGEGVHLQQLNEGVNYVLISFNSIRNVKSCLPLNEFPNLQLMIDSGAYSVWHSGKQIVLADYVAFAKKLRELLTCPIVFVNLDLMPGRYGELPTRDDCKRSADVSFENYLRIKAAGLDVLPVYHQFEDEGVIQEYKKHTDYIGISGNQNLAHKQRRQFVAEFFIKHKTNIRIHGFGHGSKHAMFSLPFFSVDSTNHRYAHNKHTGIVRVENGKQTFLPGNPEFSFQHRRNVVAYQIMARHATELWKSRGVCWETQG